MTTAHDVAAYILQRSGPMPAMKLQRLVYYCQAWSLVWDDEPIFPERIEAWAHGPVVRELYEEHRGRYELRGWPSGRPERLTAVQRETVDAVLRFYGERTSHWLTELTHMEDPWVEARRGLPAEERGDREISHAAMAEYYASVAATGGA